MIKFSCLYLPQGHHFITTVWLWSTDEYVFFFILSESPSLISEKIQWNTLCQKRFQQKDNILNLIYINQPFSTKPKFLLHVVFSLHNDFKNWHMKKNTTMLQVGIKVTFWWQEIRCCYFIIYIVTYIISRGCQTRSKTIRSKEAFYLGDFKSF